MLNTDMFKTSDRTSFLIIFFWLLQYFVFVVLNSDVFLPFFIGTCIETPSPEKKIAYKTFLHSRPFGNYWASAMFRGPDFIAKLSDGLKK